MRIKTPSTVKEWAREVELALDEAISTREGSEGTAVEVSRVDMYKMAPAIAAIYRSIESEETKRKMIAASWSAVLYVHEKIPEYKKKYRRCFIHAYLDSMIFLKLLTRTKAENVIDYLESRGVMEICQA